MLTRLRAATALQVAVRTIGKAIVRLDFDAVVFLFEFSLATEPASFSQGNVVGTSDSLISPRHIDGTARLGRQYVSSGDGCGWLLELVDWQKLGQVKSYLNKSMGIRTR